MNIEEPNKNIQRPISVGEEFITWAENYYSLNKKYGAENAIVNSESCPYEYIRDTFIKKINDTIIIRMSGKME